MKLQERDRRRQIVLTGVVAWGLSVGAGFAVMHGYEATPGLAASRVARWPSGSRLDLAGDRPTLVMAVHPRCPCTRASVSELERILARCAGRVAVHVLVYNPEHAGPRWGLTDWSGRLAALPGVRLAPDPGGVEATRFGARTSGHVVLYSPDGRLLFCGGITGARGHEGENGGRSAVISLVSGGPARLTRAFVFGCPIF